MTSVPPPPLDDETVKNPLECPSLRWGIISCGRIAHDFTQALKLLPTATAVACSARSLDDAKRFAEKHGIAKSCTCIISPPTLHVRNPRQQRLVEFLP